jgi:hypothetical protein
LSIKSPLTDTAGIVIDGGTTSNKGAVLKFSKNASVLWQMGTDSAIIGGTSDNFHLYGGGANAMLFSTNATERMRLTSGGNLLIGTTTDAGTLTVIKSVSSNNIAYIGNTNTTAGTSFGLKIAAGTNNSDYALGIDNAAATVSLLRLDGAGNLGLGVTPNTWTLGKSISVGDVGSAVFGFGGYNGLTSGAYFNSGWKYSSSSTSQKPALFVGSDGGFSWSTAAAGTAGNAITFTQAMTLDASGNLGVGDTSPSSKANFIVYKAPVSYAGLNATAVFSSTTSQATGVGGLIAFEGQYGSGDSCYGAIGGLKENSTSGNYAGYLALYTRANGSLPAERARIGSNGNVYWGCTGVVPASMYFTPDSNGGSLVSSSSTGTKYVFYFQYNNSTVGYIYNTSGGTTYNTTSDYRLKENIAPMTGALAKVAQLKPSTYKWKHDGSDGQGFIAHELQEFFPDAVVGVKDDVDENGKIKPQGIDTSFLVATLTAAIQELKAEFDAYKASHP